MTMTVEARSLRLAERFTIATKSWDVADNVFVRLSWGAHRGIGEVSPEDRTGDSVEAVVAQLESLDLGSMNGPHDLESIGRLLPAGPARCALDIAATTWRRAWASRSPSCWGWPAIVLPPPR